MVSVKHLVKQMSELAEKGGHDFSQAELIIFADSSGYFRMDGCRIDGTSFNNLEDLDHIIDQLVSRS